MPASRAFPAALAGLLLAGCATGAAGAGTEPAAPVTPVAQTWPLRTREHVDLWLTGFALLAADSARVPLYRPGYRQGMLTLAQRSGVTLSLALNGDLLRQRLAAEPRLASAQFLPLYFQSWEQMTAAIDVFLRAGGDPRQAGDSITQAAIAFLAQFFPTAADRDWLQRFTTALQSDDRAFYHAYWAQEQRALAPVFARVDSLWTGRYLPALSGFLDTSLLAAGDFLLSLPLDGEGRTVTDAKRANAITTSFPRQPADALQAIYVFAHEAVAPIVATAVRDNITPAEQRAGAASGYTSAAQVRGGLLLLQRKLPELADGYARYYLRAVGAPVSGNPADALVRAFPLPPDVASALTRQLDAVLGGI